MLCNVFVNFFHMQEVMETFTSVMRGYKKPVLTVGTFVLVCASPLILVVVKSNSHQGEHGNKSQNPKSRHTSHEGTLDYRGNCSVFLFIYFFLVKHLQPEFYCGKFLSDLFSLVLKLLFLVVNPWVSSKAIFQETPAGKYFPTGFLKPYIVSNNRAFSK